MAMEGRSCNGSLKGWMLVWAEVKQQIKGMELRLRDI